MSGSESTDSANGSSPVPSTSAPYQTQRGRARRKSRGRRGASSSSTRGARSRSRGADIEEATATTLLQDRDDMMKDKIKSMTKEQLEDLCLKMVSSHPGLIFNILKPAESVPEGFHPPSGSSTPEWCVCGQCRQMPKAEEKVCCGYRDCISLLPAVDQAQLMRYIDIEKEIKELESKNVLKAFEVRRKMTVDVKEKLACKEKELEEMIKVTNKEKGEYLELEKKSKAEIQAMFKSEADYTAKLTVEQEEFLEARSKEDTARKEVEALAAQLKELETNVEELRAPAEKIKKMYEERDNLLSDIFNGEYGSEQENILEAQYDSLLDKKQRISVANYKWTNALVLLRHATAQLRHAVNKWHEIKGKSNMQDKYNMSTEVRNNLIASIQNVRSTQAYLNTIEFPYCKPAEMETLSRAADNIYTDMADPRRHDHAANCYGVTCKRACALQQWFENVIDNTISKDLKCVCKEVEEVETKLRAERIRLIREKIQESGGDVSQISDADQMKISDEEMHGDGIGIVQPANVGDDNGLQVQQCHEPMPPAPTPLPLNQLAPAPCETDLFGDINVLKEEHAKHQMGFNKTQDLNKARMEQGLQEKLAKARRHKKR